MLVKYNGYKGDIASNITIVECYSMTYDKKRETVTLLLHGNARIIMGAISEEFYVFLMEKMWKYGKLDLTQFNIEYL